MASNTCALPSLCEPSKLTTSKFKAVVRDVGFDCEFVDKTPIKFVQSECPVCLQILREPYQAPCCGNSFCRVCIERIKTDNKPCPTCNEENFVTFHDKRLQRSLYGFQVYCSHKQEGCEWKGELGQLDNHLNLSPQPDKQLEGCEYSEIECIECFELIKRSNIAVHQNDLCPKRPFSCEYCHSYESDYEDVIHNHWPVCGYHPVRCPNECGAFPQRQALENHVTRDCPNTVTDCDFHHVGCDVRLPRKDIPAHLKENLVTHMSLQAASYSKLLASHNGVLKQQNILQDKVQNLEKENKTLKNKLDCVVQEHKHEKNELEEENRAIRQLLETIKVEISQAKSAAPNRGRPITHSSVRNPKVLPTDDPPPDRSRSYVPPPAVTASLFHSMPEYSQTSSDPAKPGRIVKLGKCSLCDECDEYESEDAYRYTDCEYCGCAASGHEGFNKKSTGWKIKNKPPPQ